MSVEDQSIINDEIKFIKILGLENAGIRLEYSKESNCRWGVPTIGIMVPCYNEQNGYYSDDLDLIISNEDGKVKFNINKFVKEEIY